MQIYTKTFCLFVFLFLINSVKVEAVVAVSEAGRVEISQESLSEGQKKKLERFQKRLAKKKKRVPKERKNKFGRLALLILLGGFLSLFIVDFLFFPALIASLVLGIIGTSQDEKKLAAIISVVLSVSILTLILLVVAALFAI